MADDRLGWRECCGKDRMKSVKDQARSQLQKVLQGVLPGRHISHTVHEQLMCYLEDIVRRLVADSLVCARHQKHHTVRLSDVKEGIGRHGIDATVAFGWTFERDRERGIQTQCSVQDYGKIFFASPLARPPAKPGCGAAKATSLDRLQRADLSKLDCFAIDPLLFQRFVADIQTPDKTLWHADALIGLQRVVEQQLLLHVLGAQAVADGTCQPEEVVVQGVTNTLQKASRSCDIQPRDLDISQVLGEKAKHIVPTTL